MEYHNCQCGSHSWPGKIVAKIGKFIVLVIKASNGTFVELRQIEYEKPDGMTDFVCSERLLKGITVLPCT